VPLTALAKGDERRVRQVPTTNQRLRSWAKLGGVPLLTLIDLVEEQLLPCFYGAGFRRSEAYLTNPRGTVSGREILLVRVAGEAVDEVIFSFDKYRRPRFQIHLSKRRATPPNAWIRSTSVVARCGQRIHFWGKPLWLPTALWSVRKSERTIGRILLRIDQALLFLANGHPGPAFASSDAH
jgi:hypothetical protein